MRHVASKVLPNDDMPRRAEPLIELFLDLRGDVLLDVVLLQRERRDVDGFLLHLLAHVNVLDDSFGASRAIFGNVCGGGWGVDFFRRHRGSSGGRQAGGLFEFERTRLEEGDCLEEKGGEWCVKYL